MAATALPVLRLFGTVWVILAFVGKKIIGL